MFGCYCCGLVAYLILALLCVDCARLSYCVCCSLCFVDFEFLCALGWFMVVNRLLFPVVLYVFCL